MALSQWSKFPDLKSPLSWDALAALQTAAINKAWRMPQMVWTPILSSSQLSDSIDNILSTISTTR